MYAAAGVEKISFYLCTLYSYISNTNLVIYHWGRLFTFSSLCLLEIHCMIHTHTHTHFVLCGFIKEFQIYGETLFCGRFVAVFMYLTIHSSSCTLFVCCVFIILYNMKLCICIISPSQKCGK